jgi:hypothetical protein
MKTPLRLTGLIVIASLLAACNTLPEREPYYDRHVVRSAPPAPYYEYQGYPPAVGYVWIGGYWNWVGVRYQWIPGRWEAPRPGYVWVPHRWEQRGGQWHQDGGRWDKHDDHHRHDNHYRQPAPPVVRYEQHAPVRVQEAPRHEQERRHQHVEQPVLVRPAPQVERREQIEPPRSAAPLLTRPERESRRPEQARPEREARQLEQARPQERREERRDRREQRGNDRRQEEEERRR